MYGCWDIYVQLRHMPFTMASTGCVLLSHLSPCVRHACVRVCVCLLSVLCLFIGCCECSGTEKKGSCYSLLREKEETLGKDLGKLSNTIYPSSSSSFSSFRTAPQEASGDRLQSSCSTNQRSVDTVWTRSIEHILCCLHMATWQLRSVIILLHYWVCLRQFYIHWVQCTSHNTRRKRTSSSAVYNRNYRLFHTPCRRRSLCHW